MEESPIYDRLHSAASQETAVRQGGRLGRMIFHDILLRESTWTSSGQKLTEDEDNNNDDICRQKKKIGMDRQVAPCQFQLSPLAADQPCSTDVALEPERGEWRVL